MGRRALDGVVALALATGLLAAGLPAASAAAAATAPGCEAPLCDAPIVWYEADCGCIPEPQEIDPNELATMINAVFRRPTGRLTNPIRLLRRAGTVAGGQIAAPAANVNRLDEVPNSSWFTNRIGLFPLAPGGIAAGPGGEGPDRDAPWTVVGAKTEGVTPGFRIRDARGRTFLLKFDPPGWLGLTIRAGVVASRLLHAAGYNVPRDHVVGFGRQDLRIDEGVALEGRGGREVPLTAARLDSLLAAVGQVEPGRWEALASEFVDGKPVGPFDWQGDRDTDPNDRIEHQHRRELRGLRVLAAWLNHFDTKRQNTLDVYVERDGCGHLRHYLIDLASTLGAGGRGPESKWGHEYGIDVPAAGSRLLTLGLLDDPWMRLRPPHGTREVGILPAEFDPEDWDPFVPNTAFANLTDRDGYWAAKIVSAFRREHLEAAVAAGRYRDPGAAAYLVRALEGRRDCIARHWFARVVPLDFFVPDPNAVAFRDLALERGVASSPSAAYRARWAAVDAQRRPATWLSWRELASTRAPLPLPAELAGAPATERPFLALQVEVDRGGGWQGPVTVYLSRRSGQVVSLER